MRLFAPGKLVIMGEYAVLQGAPAVVAAIDQGVECSVSPGDQVETPGDDRFVREGLLAVNAPPQHYRFINRPRWPHAEKPGLGGSASAVVAACAAGLSAQGQSWDNLLEISMAAHFRVQGSGSGLDVRASVEGGMRRVEANASQALSVLPLSVVWSGSSAQTGPRVARYLQWSDSQAFVERTTELVDLFVSSPVAALSEALELLRSMARQTGISYDTPALNRIAQIALEHGGASKPSGAGGGDISVGWIPDPIARTAFHQACEKEGLMPIPTQIRSGVQLESMDA